MRMGNHKTKESGKLSQLWLLLLILCIGFGAYWLTVTAIPNNEKNEISENRSAKPSSVCTTVESPKPRKSTRPTISGDPDAAANGAIRNQRAIVFTDDEAMRKFLSKLGDGVNLLGRIDKLNTLLIGYGNLADLEALLDGSEEKSMNYPVNIPAFESVGAQAGSAPLENGLLKWLGVEGDNSLWGKGVTIAILDTGIADHSVFQNEIQRINLVPLPENPADLNGHGTAVASLIFSNNTFAPGVAPGATPLSVRIADDNGSSNSFLISQGIIAAVDAGAQLINISLGGQGKSNIVDKAVEYAEARGAVIVAAAGNSGTDGVLQPAANPSVIAVGAVDASNQAMAFSTTGSEVAISAPGYKVNVAYPGDSAAQVNGTSFSAPIAVGAIAGVASSSGTQTMTAQQAADLVLGNLNDVGIQGKDDSTGSGVPDMARIINAGTPGRYDAAINSIYTTDDNQVQVLVQNLGTETLVNAGISVNINGSITQANITTLAPNETRLITVPKGSTADLNIQSTVRLSGSQNDQRPSNDSLSQKIIPAP